MGKHYTDAQKERIFTLSELKFSQREISKMTGFPRSSIQEILSKREKKIDCRKSGSGRPKKISKKNSIILEAISAEDSSRNLTEMKNILREKTNIEISRETTRKELAVLGIKPYKAIKKPFVDKRNRERRFNIACKYLEKEDSYWNNVIFSDETTFELFPSSKNKTVYRKKHEKLIEENITKTKKFGGGKIMFWGCFSANGTGKLVAINGNLNAGKYINILANNLERSARMMDLDFYVFQQDGAPCHTARITENWFERKGIELLDWPAQSPDLNPIENLWSYIKRKLSKIKIVSLEDLKDHVMKIWSEITPELCKRLIDSMPRRAQECYDARGGYIKY